MSTSTALVPADVDARTAEVERQVAEARAQAEAIQVRNPAEADQAAALLRQIAARRKAAEAERKELTGPLDEAKRRIMQKFKDAMAPYDEADEVVRGKVGVYTAEQERIRKEEEARLEAERQERERIARETREKQEAEERAKREQAEKEEREAEEERRKAKDAADREAAEKLVEEARQKADEAKTAEVAISSLPEVSLPKAVVETAPKPEGISTRKVWKLMTTNVEKLPPEYLVPNEKALNAAMREGVKENGQPPEIPGAAFEQVSEMAVRS